MFRSGVISVRVGQEVIVRPAVLPSDPRTLVPVAIMPAAPPTLFSTSLGLLPDDYSIPPSPTGALGISKSSWATASDVAKGAALVAGAVSSYARLAAIFTALPSGGLSVATLGTVSAVAGAVAVGLAGAAYVFDHLSKDPPDEDYTDIVHVTPIDPPQLNFGAKYAQMAVAARDYIRAQLRIARPVRDGIRHLG
jgi:hypothetical protein